MTIHSLRLIVGVVNPPTKQMDKARTINATEIGLGIPAFSKASLLVPMSNKLIKEVAMFSAVSRVPGTFV